MDVRVEELPGEADPDWHGTSGAPARPWLAGAAAGSNVCVFARRRQRGDGYGSHCCRPGRDARRWHVQDRGAPAGGLGASGRPAGQTGHRQHSAGPRRSRFPAGSRRSHGEPDPHRAGGRRRGRRGPARPELHRWPGAGWCRGGGCAAGPGGWTLLGRLARLAAIKGRPCKPAPRGSPARGMPVRLPGFRRLDRWLAGP